MPRFAGELALALALVATPLQLYTAPAWAQPDEAQRAAAASFAEGEAAFRAGDFRSAGASFDAAYQQAPHHSPLWNAARAWERAGEPARAANRYAQYLDEAPAAAPDREQAKSALDALEPKLGILEILPAGLTEIVVDGERPRRPSAHHVTAGEHEITAVLGGRSVGETVRVDAGERRQVLLEAPPPAPTPAPSAAVTAASAPPPAPPREDVDDSSGWPAWIALTSGGLTLLAGGHIVWSGIDTLNARDEFDAAPTQDALDDGIRRQQRTNFLIGLTSVLGGFTVVALALTDWGGGGEEPTAIHLPPRPAASVRLGAGSLVLSGSF